jgi:hypothetical protein
MITIVFAGALCAGKSAHDHVSQTLEEDDANIDFYRRLKTRAICS